MEGGLEVIATAFPGLSGRLRQSQQSLNSRTTDLHDVVRIRNAFLVQCIPIINNGYGLGQGKREVEAIVLHARWLR